MGLDFLLLFVVGDLGGLERGLQVLGFLHEDQLAVFHLNDEFLTRFDLVLERGELVILAGLELLVLVSMDLVLLGLDLDFEFLALNFDLALTSSGGFEPVVGAFQFPLAGGLFGGEGGDFGQDGAKLLIPILKGEEFFDGGEHEDGGKEEGKMKNEKMAEGTRFLIRLPYFQR